MVVVLLPQSAGLWLISDLFVVGLFAVGLLEICFCFRLRWAPQSGAVCIRWIITAKTPVTNSPFRVFVSFVVVLFFLLLKCLLFVFCLRPLGKLYGALDSSSINSDSFSGNINISGRKTEACFSNNNIINVNVGREANCCNGIDISATARINGTPNRGFGVAIAICCAIVKFES